MIDILRIKNLGVTFVSEENPINAVIDASLFVKRSQRVGLIGESGSGKSVIARAILKLHNSKTTHYHKSSKIELDGHDVLALTESRMHKLRGETISMVFQNPMHSLNPSFRIGTQLKSVLSAHRKLRKFEASRAIFSALKSVDLPDASQLVHRYPHELSGGQRQRIMIAMAILCEPKLIIADEPTSALDVTAQDTVLQILKRLSIEKNIAILMITHDMGVIAQFCEVVNVMYGGRIVETADVNILFERPAHPYTSALLAATPDPSRPDKIFASIPGIQPSRTGVMSSACAFIERCPFAKHKCKTAPELQNLNKDQRVACHFAGELPLMGQGFEPD